MKKLLKVLVLVGLFSTMSFSMDSMLNYAKPTGDSQDVTTDNGAKFYYYPIECKNGRVGRVWVGTSGRYNMYVTDMQNVVRSMVIKSSNYDFREKLPKIVKDYCQ